MNERSLRFCSWWTRDRVSRYGIIAFVCKVTSRRFGCGCKVWSFTTLGEGGLSLSLRLCSMKTLSSIQEMTSN